MLTLVCVEIGSISWAKRKNIFGYGVRDGGNTLTRMR
jgi:hypothetical protein